MLVLFLLIFLLYYIQYVEVRFFEDLKVHSWWLAYKVEACLKSRLSLRRKMNLIKVKRFEKEFSLLFEFIGFRTQNFDIPPANHWTTDLRYLNRYRHEFETQTFITRENATSKSLIRTEWNGWQDQRSEHTNKRG